MSGEPWSNEPFSLETRNREAHQALELRNKEIQKLTDALKKYGFHIEGCTYEESETCTCGLLKILDSTNFDKKGG